MEQRRRMRVECHLAASVGGPEGERVRGWVRNMSGVGMFVETAGRLPVGTRCQVALLVGEGGDGRPAHAVGDVVRHEPDGLVLHLVKVDPDAADAVRRMLAPVA
jgi:PilZ domain